MIDTLLTHWQMVALLLLAVISAIAIGVYAWRSEHNPNPDNLPPDSRVSEDEPRIWGNDK